MDAASYLNIGAIAALTVVLCFLAWRKHRLPPGPWGLPVLGYYPFLGKEPEKTIDELGKKYGSIFGLRIGTQYLVVLNDWDALVEAYKLDATLDRPDTIFGSVPFHVGISGANGEEWHYVRRLMMKSFKDIGLHNTRWEELIKEEVSDIALDIASRGPEPIELKRFLETHFANSIMTLVLGHRLPEDHPLLEVVNKGIDAVLANTPTMGLANFSPRLMKLMQMIGVEQKFDVQKHLEGFSKFVVSATEEKLKKGAFEDDDSFIELFRQGLQNLFQRAMDEELIAYSVKGNVISLLSGGSETSRSSLLHLLAAVAENPEKQTKIQEELDRVIGQDGSLYWSDRAKVPYTYAAILESMRWKTLVPLSTMRKATEDIQVQGYDIPKGTFITFHTYHLHNDLKYWTEPKKFVPERFLTHNGTKVVTDVKSYAPFSLGKRNCPGKLIAHLELFQYFVTLMQKFKVTPCDGDKVGFKHSNGLTFAPYDLKLLFRTKTLTEQIWLFY